MVVLGFLNMGKFAVDLFWVHPDSGARTFQSKLPIYPHQGEPHWRTVRLGHQFVLVSTVTKETMREITVHHEGMAFVGDEGPRPAGPRNASKAQHDARVGTHRGHRLQHEHCAARGRVAGLPVIDRKSTRLNSSH